MGALIAIYLSMPLLYKLQKESEKSFNTMLVALSLLYVAIDLASIAVKR